MTDDLLGPRFGLAHDRLMAKYHRWGWDRWPLRFPACEVTLEQQPSETSRVSWAIEAGVPIATRMVRGDGRVLHEVISVPAGAIPGVQEREFVLPPLAADDAVGFAFEWVFELPVRPTGEYHPTHPLGVVLFPAARVIGQATLLTVRAKIRG